MLPNRNMEKKKTVIFCFLVTTVTVCVILSYVTQTPQAQNAFALLSVTRNLSAHTSNKSHGEVDNSTKSVTIPIRAPPVGPKLSIEYLEKLRNIGIESTKLHDFKSTYIIDPIIYDNNTVHRQPGNRTYKIISCFNCPIWFTKTSTYFAHNGDFRECPYSECRYDSKGVDQTKADVVLFFPTPSEFPFRPLGQIWAYCSWESPVHYGYPCEY